MKKALSLIEAGLSSSFQEQQPIKKFSFGEIEGIENLLPNLETLDENLAPPTKLLNPDKNICLIKIHFQKFNNDFFFKSLSHTDAEQLLLNFNSKWPMEWRCEPISTNWFFSQQGIEKAFSALKHRKTIKHNVLLADRL